MVVKYLPINDVRFLLGDSNVYDFHAGTTTVLDSGNSSPSLRTNWRENRDITDGSTILYNTDVYKMFSINRSEKHFVNSFGNDRNLGGRQGNYFLAYAKLWTSPLSDHQFQKEEQDALTFFDLGDVFTGIDMQNNHIINVKNATNDTDGVNKNQLYGFLKSDFLPLLSLTSLMRDGVNYNILPPYICIDPDDGFFLPQLPKAK